MKTKISGFIVVLLLVVFKGFAENKTQTFIVKGGDCNECKLHIEKSALSVNGVSIADWDRETKELQVVFDDSKTNIDEIQAAIAKGGNGTPNHKANEEAYNQLPDCCKYEK